MKYAFLAGCKGNPPHDQYARSSRSVLEGLGVELVDLEFNCCGYRVRNINFESFVLAAAWNIALAEKHGLDIVTPCQCCYGAMKHADHFLRERDELRREVNGFLRDDRLSWSGRSQVKHLLTVLAHDVGLEAIGSRVARPFSRLRVAAHYGCHALRPGKIMRFDDPLAPTILENLVRLTGAECVDWPQRLDCCGNPLWEKNNRLSLELMRKKLDSAMGQGADCIITSCNGCQIQFDEVQADHQTVDDRGNGRVGSLFYPQLLGLTLGLSADDMGLANHKVDVRPVLNHLS